MAFVGSLDQGTSSTRFMIFDQGGKVVGQHQLEHRQILPQAGWVEHDAAEIWDRVQEVIAGALKQANLLGSDLASIGITNHFVEVHFSLWQGQTTSTGKPAATKVPSITNKTTAALSRPITSAGPPSEGSSWVSAWLSSI